MDNPPLFQLQPNTRSRSICFENPTGAPGNGGRAASPLGVGRKGDPARVVEAGATVTLADIEGTGIIRHIWLTTPASRRALRGAVIRMYWEGATFPSLELPLGDFFGFAHGATASFQTAVHAVGERYGMNSYLPMPFNRHARIELANETPKPMTVFYQVDYTEEDELPAHSGNLHGCFQRQNPTTPGVDFEFLPQRQGAGRFLGVVFGIRPLVPDWWGEGEVKFYMDGDDEFATIVGTGSEDYVGLSYGIQQTAFAQLGASRVDPDQDGIPGAVSMYRWHLTDPIVWHERLRATIQQIGHAGQPVDLDAYKGNLFERADDWSAASFWYAEELAPLPACPALDERVRDLPPAPGSDSATRP